MYRICIEQNMETILKLQFSQRKHYEIAEHYNNISWILAVLIVVLNIISIFFPFIGEVPLWMNCILVFIIFAVNRTVIKNVKIGAITKEYIDSKLFYMECRNKYGDYSIDKIDEYASRMLIKYPQEYTIQITNTGKDKPPGLKDQLAK